ncbi:arginine repressor [Streptococcus sp. X16XC17]|uniref:arginine repressor n=1 Tax=unclassified Streptococcus TaxID=2608887 RepID=UPI00066FF575|nr:MULTISPECIES: arginine repressor [unclassified Streptococcus]TCD46009.1 arginine repressor [Streptococcus sp. X16XC17]
MRKSERLQVIRDMVLLYPIDTQEEIVERLRGMDIVATQATVSRDIKELGIVKVPSKDSGYIYGLPKSSALKHQMSNILEVEKMGNMLNVKLVPGSSTVVKRHIIDRFADQLFSIIADDDSLLMIVKDEEFLPELEENLKVW